MRSLLCSLRWDECHKTKVEGMNEKTEQEMGNCLAAVLCQV